MSLLSYSSYRTDDTSDRNDNCVSRKRTPTLGGVRKTVKVRPNYDSLTDNYATVDSVETPSDANSRGNKMPESFEDHLDKQTERNTKINSILNKITSFSSDDKLGDFNPMPYPTIITKKNNTDNIIAAEEQVDNGLNPLMPKIGKVLGPQLKPNEKQQYFRASEPGERSQYATYRDAYGKEGLSGMGMTKEPYYAKMGIGGGSGDKVMDRLNYMTQMLESLQMEKTNHATEEFVLYCLLGVFMIYIVDGFSRGGKYVR